MPRLATILIAAAAMLVAQDSRPETHPGPYDILIQGGRVVDGTGAPAVDADVGIVGNRIVAVGALDAAAAKRVIHAHRMTVAPGFIDPHVHVDYEIFRHPIGENFLLMGTTTVLTGNCGTSVENVAIHLGEVERQGVGLNYGTFIGHGTVREAVMPGIRREPKTSELVAMEDRVAQAMVAGAFGVSTGLIYPPGIYAQTPEITSIARAASFHGGVYVTHLRSEGKDQDAALAEAFKIAREANMPVHIAHIKCAGKARFGRAPDVIRLIEAARADGLVVTADQYAYDASSTALDVLFEAADLAGGRRAFGDRLAGDAAFRAKVEEGLLAKARANGFADLAYARVADAPNRADMNGKTLAEVATTPAAQARLATDLVIAAKGARVSMVYHAMDEADVRAFMKCPWVAVGSDAGVRVDDGSKPHPRGAGNHARVLGRYVRDHGVLAIEEAVRKMTQLPARTFGIPDRGEIRPGAFADLVIFDAAAIADRASYAEPRAAPAGIQAVLVNGVVMVERGAVNRFRPGAVLRHTRAR